MLSFSSLKVSRCCIRLRHWTDSLLDNSHGPPIGRCKAVPDVVAVENINVWGAYHPERTTLPGVSFPAVKTHKALTACIR